MEARRGLKRRLLKEEKDEVHDDAVGDHSWVRFVAEVPVAVDIAGIGKSASTKHTISINSRATDSRGEKQPETPGRQRTYIYNGWGTASVTALMPHCWHS